MTSDPRVGADLGVRTWTELAVAAEHGSRPILVVPIGSCEQHGPHLPLDTDTRVAVHLAAELASRNDDVVVGPALGITASGEHAGFPGTLSIGTAALRVVLVELVRSAGWARGVVLVNGHGGNRDAVEASVRTLVAESRKVLAWWPHISAADAHAGRTETSMMLAIAPRVVRADALEVGCTEPLHTLLERLRAVGVAGTSANGVLGDPRLASADEGHRILGALGDDLAIEVAAWDR